MISNSPLEKNIKQLQQYVNDSIDAKYRDYSFSYSVKYSYLTEQQKKSVTELEIEEFSNKLMLFVRDNRVLKQIIHDIEKPDFLWEGSFVECLSREEKKIYVEYDFSSFNILEFINRLQKDPTITSVDLLDTKLSKAANTAGSASAIDFSLKVNKSEVGKK